MNLRLLSVFTVLGVGVSSLITPMVRPAAAQAPGYVVVVNAASPTTRISRPELSRIFLKRRATWDGGEPIVPVDLRASARIRETFSREIHRSSVAAIKAYWQQEIFSGRDTPPEEMVSEDEVLTMIRSVTGAVGYVSASHPLGPDVRVVAVSD
jgi:ABC-type phosphate transport system substrate-binding protein